MRKTTRSVCSLNESPSSLRLIIISCRKNAGNFSGLDLKHYQTNTSAPPAFLYVPKDNCSTNTSKWCDPLIGPKDYTPKNLGSILQFLLTYFCTFCKNCYDTDDTLKQHLSLHKMTQQMLKCIVDRHNSRRTRHISIIHAVVVEVNCIVSWLTTSQQCNQSQTVQLQLKTSVFLSTMTTKTKIFVDKK